MTPNQARELLTDQLAHLRMLLNRIEEAGYMSDDAEDEVEAAIDTTADLLNITRYQNSDAFVRLNSELPNRCEGGLSPLVNALAEDLSDC